MIIFNKISEFLEFNKRCPLCQSYLIPFLKDTLNGASHHPKIFRINTPLQGDKFIFTISYVSQSIHFQPPPKSCSIDINSNIFYVDFYSISLIDIKNIFDNMYPVIELRCCDKKCKTYRYYIISNILKCSIVENKIVIPNICINSECFNLSSWWILNDFTNETTNIFASSGDAMGNSSPPITVSLLNFSSLGKEKIFNKIKTLVNFS